MDRYIYSCVPNTMMFQIKHEEDNSKKYVLIAAFLGVITLIEVALFYSTSFNLPVILIPLSFIKFLVVVGFFMNLQFEKKLLKLFFLLGFVLSIPFILILFLERGVI